MNLKAVACLGVTLPYLLKLYQFESSLKLAPKLNTSTSLASSSNSTGIVLSQKTKSKPVYRHFCLKGKNFHLYMLI